MLTVQWKGEPVAHGYFSAINIHNLWFFSVLSNV